MEPVAIFGFVVNIATLIDLGVKVIDIYKRGTVSFTAQLDEMEGLCRTLQTTNCMSQPTVPGSREADLQDFARQCIDKAARLRRELGLPVPPGPRWRRALRTTGRILSGKMPDLEREWVDIRRLLDTKLLITMRETININEAKQTDAFRSLNSVVQNLFVQFCDSQITAVDLVLDQKTRIILNQLDEIHKAQTDNETQRDEMQRKDRLLRSLVHGDPFTRENDILEKLDGTFDWFFNEAAGSGFERWLRSQNGGIFWIQGKPGAGKSTLMKFICRSRDRIKQSLQKSAPGKAAVAYSFYFWLADGTKMQSSERGLLCSLLYQFLETSWVLEPELLTDTKLRQMQTQKSWDLPNLRSLVLRSAVKLLEDYAVFIFVDALDECIPDNQEGVLDILKQLSTRGIKICVSSRPEQLFVRKLGPNATAILKVESHTKRDIAKFVKKEFGALDCRPGALSPSELKNLAFLIIERAEGVFLWATLVAKDVCEGIMNGDSKEQLGLRIGQLPDDLKSLYHNMVKRRASDQKPYKEEAAAYFRLVLYSELYMPMVLVPCDNGLPLTHCISEYKRLHDRDPEFYTQNLDVVMSSLEKRINIVSAGMLICVQPHAEDRRFRESSQHKVVRFVHRTARDFLLEYGEEILRYSSLCMFEFYYSATAGFLRTCYFDRIPEDEAGPDTTLAISDIVESNLEPEEKVNLLCYLDVSLALIYTNRHWAYTQWRYDCTLRGEQMDCLDLLGLAIQLTTDIALLDELLHCFGHSSKRYKTYLLLLACKNVDACSNGIKKLLANGADPNEEMFPYVGYNLPSYKIKSSPWIRFLDYSSWWDHIMDREILKTFLHHGSNLGETTIWRLCITPGTGDIQHGWGIIPDLQCINILLHTNVLYLLKAFFRIPMESISSAIGNKLPAAYCKPFGLYSPIDLPAARIKRRPVSPFRYDREYPEVFENASVHVISKELSIDNSTCLHTPDSSEALLQNVLSYTHRLFLQSKPVDDLDKIIDWLSGFQKRTTPMSLKAYALEKGFLIQNSDPASLFPDYEDYIGSDGKVDLGLLFADFPRRYAIPDRSSSTIR